LLFCFFEVKAARVIAALYFFSDTFC
jgi:hypothetical protein